jgi:hypothetical protein
MVRNKFPGYGFHRSSSELSGFDPSLVRNFLRNPAWGASRLAKGAYRR